MASESSSGDDHDVHVWHAHIDRPVAQGPAVMERALAVLGAAERARYDRFRHDADRRMFLLGRVMARAAVGRALGVAPTAWRWREGLRGRPEIEDAGCPLSFNLAHSAGLVVCALSWRGPVGVDVEDRAREPLDRALVARCCSAEEAADVDAHADRWRDRFLQYWTLKEAYLKAIGLGISVHLPDVRFDLSAGVRAAFQGSLDGQDAGWCFELAAFDAGHFVAVAAAAPGGRPLRVVHAAFPDQWWP